MNIDKIELKNNTQLYKISVLYKGNNHRYNKNYFELYMQNDEILFIRENNEEEYIPNLDGIDYNVKRIVDTVERFSEIIVNTFYSILDKDNTKEYIPKKEDQKYLVKISKKI